MKVEESKKFHINSSFKEFTDRQKNVFDQLGALEQSSRISLSQNDTPMETNDLDQTITSTPKSPLRHLQGTESLFKKPQSRPLKHFKTILNRTVPDYQINPHKWTKYSLDVSKEDMSEKSNTNAAMAFLKELELRNQHSLDSPTDQNMSKFTFKKVVSQNLEQDKPIGASFRNSKVVMPDLPKVGTNDRTEVKLGHINFDDENESESNDN
ncbi:hypothetical protein FQR65_LT07337 [Abscondita terminalis]|nr:hypothetical protein FQR65_LT07337 [Abscondita terminalis]